MSVRHIEFTIRVGTKDAVKAVAIKIHEPHGAAEGCHSARVLRSHFVVGCLSTANTGNGFVNVVGAVPDNLIRLNQPFVDVTEQSSIRLHSEKQRR